MKRRPCGGHEVAPRTARSWFSHHVFGRSRVVAGPLFRRPVLECAPGLSVCWEAAREAEPTLWEARALFRAIVRRPGAHHAETDYLIRKPPSDAHHRRIKKYFDFSPLVHQAHSDKGVGGGEWRQATQAATIDAGHKHLRRTQFAPFGNKNDAKLSLCLKAHVAFAA